MRKPTALPGGGPGRPDPPHDASPADDRGEDRPLELDEERTADFDVTAEPREPEAAPAASSTDSLIWPPPEEDMNGWEIVPFEPGGRTLIEPMQPLEARPADAGVSATPSASAGPDTPPPAPRLYSTIPTPPAALALPSDEGLSIDRSVRVDHQADPRTPAEAWGPRVRPHLSLRSAADENLPETQVIEPLVHGELAARATATAPAPGAQTPTPVRPMAAHASNPYAASPPTVARVPGAPRHPTPQIIVQGAHPAAGNAPTEARLSARDQTHPRMSPIGRPSSPVTVPHAGDEDSVDPSAQTRILPLPPGFAKPRMPASMVDTLREEEPRGAVADARAARRDPITEARAPRAPQAPAWPIAPDPRGPATLDPLATNVWPSPPMAESAGASSGVASGWPVRAADAALEASASEAAVETSVPTEGRRFPIWRIALAVLILVALAEIAYLAVRTLRPSAGATVDDAPATSGAPSATPRTTPDAAPTASPGETSAAPASGAASPAATSAATSAAAPASASLDVRSDPPGARVTIGGVARGRTPVVVTGLAPGRHQVRVSGPFDAIVRTVTLTAGQRGSLSVAPRPADPTRTDTASAAGGGAAAQVTAGDAAARPAPVGRGWLAIDSPIVLRVTRNGDFLGTSEDGRIPLPAGTHDIGLENESVNFREVRRVEVPVGRGVPLSVTLPSGTLNINAVPWAEVFVDGQRIGETPVSQLALPIGPHEILYRHPQFGDRRVTVIVKVGTPGRTFVDFTK